MSTYSHFLNSFTSYLIYQITPIMSLHLSLKTLSQFVSLTSCVLLASCSLTHNTNQTSITTNTTNNIYNQPVASNCDLSSQSSTNISTTQTNLTSPTINPNLIKFQNNLVQEQNANQPIQGTELTQLKASIPDLGQLQAFIYNFIKSNDQDPLDTRYYIKALALNSKVPTYKVVLIGDYWCGTGGCDHLLVVKNSSSLSLASSQSKTKSQSQTNKLTSTNKQLLETSNSSKHLASDSNLLASSCSVKSLKPNLTNTNTTNTLYTVINDWQPVQDLVVLPSLRNNWHKLKLVLGGGGSHASNVIYAYDPKAHKYLAIQIIK